MEKIQTIKAIKRAAKNARKEISDNVKLIKVLSLLDDVEKLVKEDVK